MRINVLLLCLQIGILQSIFHLGVFPWQIQGAGWKHSGFFFFNHFLCSNVLDKLYDTKCKLRDFPNIFPLFLRVTNTIHITSAVHRWLPLKTPVYQNTLVRNDNVIAVLIKSYRKYPVPTHPELMELKGKKLPSLSEFVEFPLAPC